MCCHVSCLRYDQWCLRCLRWSGQSQCEAEQQLLRTLVTGHTQPGSDNNILYFALITIIISDISDSLTMVTDGGEILGPNKNLIF